MRLASPPAAAWRLCASLNALRFEVDTAWPSRSLVSDGTIGDRSHQSRESDHNPNEHNVVRAWDLTNDVAHGPDLALLASWLVGFGKRGSDRLQQGSYIVHNGRFASYKTLWNWREYRGKDAHTTHLHISAPFAREFYDISRPWGCTRRAIAKG